MSGWDKFAFITAVGADGRLTVGARLVITQTVWNWTAVDRATSHVRQATIAERLGVSLCLVKNAFAAGKRHGYIVVETPRKRGPGAHGADVNRFCLTEKLGADSAPHSESELGLQNTPHSGMRSTKRQNEVYETSELGLRANAPTSENDVPNCSLNAPLGALPEEPPPRTCTQHAHWDGPSCVTCRSDKNAYIAWLTDSRRLLAELDYQRDRATGTEAGAISNQRRQRIAVFQRLGENWK